MMSRIGDDHRLKTLDRKEKSKETRLFYAICLGHIIIFGTDLGRTVFKDSGPPRMDFDLLEDLWSLARTGSSNRSGLTSSKKKNSFRKANFWILKSQKNTLVFEITQEICLLGLVNCCISLMSESRILFGKGPGGWDSLDSWDGWDGWDSWDQQ